jgi:hypothetical protein
MKRNAHLVLWAICAALVITLMPERTSASDKLNFSGKYVFDKGKKSDGQDASILEVDQNDDSFEITRVELGKKTVSHCPLNGSDGDYTSPGGMAGKCKVQLKPKYLILESVVLTRPQQAAPPLRIHTKEKWQLSADTKTLTIKSDVDFPDVPADISAMVADRYASGTVKYKRIVP